MIKKIDLYKSGIDIEKILEKSPLGSIMGAIITEDILEIRQHFKNDILDIIYKKYDPKNLLRKAKNFFRNYIQYRKAWYTRQFIQFQEDHPLAEFNDWFIELKNKNTINLSKTALISSILVHILKSKNVDVYLKKQFERLIFTDENVDESELIVALKKANVVVIDPEVCLGEYINTKK